MSYCDNFKTIVDIGFNFRDKIMNEQITNDIDNEDIRSFNEVKNSKINS